jgi:regulator of sirC expression with transglutaminase-like and TPR domain
MTRDDILARLSAFGEQDGENLDICRAALLLANLDLPATDLTPYYDQLDDITSGLRTASFGTSTLPERVAALSDTLYRKHKFRGDTETYDDPQNANLIRVIDRRKGLPVALGILAMHTVRSQGWTISGLNFPGHFLLRLDMSGAHALIDPFNEAKIVGTGDLQQIYRRLHGRDMPLSSEIVQPVSDRNILLRLQNNIKLRALGDGDRKRAAEVLRSMLLIAPSAVDALAELAILEAGEGNIRSAIARLEDFMARHPGSGHATGLQQLKAKLSRNLN